MGVESIKAWPAWAWIAPSATPTFPQPGETRVPQLQHHEHPTTRRRPSPLLFQIVPTRGEKPRRYRHHPLPTAHPLGHKHPPLADLDVVEA